ncbi:MAG TPA: histidine kinase dimerization/phospho-acceptor domain-containing protein [Gaiellaceae bacterium]|nr:histidine kinase dimerization/phospho-acceptor domain-containing protein [Gaiellaceae bacterium]
MAEDARFARIVSIGAHDLKTPLATVVGFARTLARTELGDPAAKYVDMIEAASTQLDDLIEELALAARIESGRYSPVLVETDTLTLAHAVAADLPERVEVSGEGATVSVDPDATARSLSRLAKAASRHGGIDSVSLVVAGRQLAIAPLLRNAAGVVTGEELRELGAVVAVEQLRALGVTVVAEDERLLIHFPG